MKTFLAALILTVLSSQATAYDLQRSMADGWEQRRQLSEIQRMDQANRQRQMELNDRMQQLERRERIESL